MTVLLVCVICGFPRPWPSCLLLWNEGGHGIFNVRNDLCGCCAHDPRRGRCRQLICRNVGRAEAQSVLQTVRSNSHQCNCWRVRHGRSFRLSGPAVISATVGRTEAQSVLQTVRSSSHQHNCWKVRHGQSFRLSGPAVISTTVGR